MSETGAGTFSEAPTTGLVDEIGNRIGSGQIKPATEPLIRFSREQPLATALIALVIGYLLGKVI